MIVADLRYSHASRELTGAASVPPCRARLDLVSSRLRFHPTTWIEVLAKPLGLIICEKETPRSKDHPNLTRGWIDGLEFRWKSKSSLTSFFLVVVKVQKFIEIESENALKAVDFSFVP